jgi:hypothetical protein
MTRTDGDSESRYVSGPHSLYEAIQDSPAAKAARRPTPTPTKIITRLSPVPAALHPRDSRQASYVLRSRAHAGQSSRPARRKYRCTPVAGLIQRIRRTRARGSVAGRARRLRPGVDFIQNLIAGRAAQFPPQRLDGIHGRDCRSHSNRHDGRKGMQQRGGHLREGIVHLIAHSRLIIAGQAPMANMANMANYAHDENRAGGTQLAGIQMRLPTASFVPKACRARLSSITTTGSLPMRSWSLKKRPCRSGMPVTFK